MELIRFEDRELVLGGLFLLAILIGGSSILAALLAMRSSQVLLKLLADSPENARSEYPGLGAIDLDREGRVVSWNRGAEDLTGFTAEEAKGKTFAWFFTAEDFEAGRPGLELTAAAERERHSIEVWFRHQRRGKFWAGLSLTAMRDDRGIFTGWTLVLYDLTLHKQGDDELARRNELLTEMLVSAPLPMIATDSQGQISVWTKAAEKLFGWAESQALHQDWLDVIGLDSETRELIAHDLEEEEGFSGEQLRGKTKDGDSLLLSFWAAPIATHDGHPQGLFCLFLDETERQTLEQGALQAATLKERLLTIVGHDLFSPCTAIRMSAEILRDRDTLDPQSKRFAQLILASANRMSRLISDIRDLSNSRRGHAFALERKPIELADICRQVIEEVQALYPDRAVTLATHGSGKGSWDPDRIAQVVCNLLSNALTYGDETQPVSVSLDERNDFVELTVHNLGLPIPPESMERIFEPFCRGIDDSEHSRNLGLGLFIARRIAEAHGGEIAVHSDREAGTTFSVRLPRGVPEAPHAFQSAVN